MILNATCNKLWNQLLVCWNLMLEDLNSLIVSTLHFTLTTLHSARVVRAALIASTERPWSTLVNEKLVRLLKRYLVVLKSIIVLNYSIVAWHSLIGLTQRLNFVLNNVIQCLLGSFFQSLVKDGHGNCLVEVDVVFPLRHFNCVTFLGTWMLLHNHI